MSLVEELVRSTLLVALFEGVFAEAAIVFASNSLGL